MYFLLLAQEKPIAKVTGMVTSAQGVFTGWLPGYLLLDGVMGPAAEAAATPATPATETPGDTGSLLLSPPFDVAQLSDLGRILGLG